MAGFEVVVRPVVFPSIRPAPARSLPPEDAPDKGLCVITGSGGTSLEGTFSYSVSSSKSRPVETERRYDEVTIYQQLDDGTVNKENFVKVKAANRITMREPRQEGDPIPHIDNITGLPRPSGFGEITKPHFYARVQPADNIEITRTDVVEKNPAAAPGGE